MTTKINYLNPIEIHLSLLGYGNKSISIKKKYRSPSNNIDNSNKSYNHFEGFLKYPYKCMILFFYLFKNANRFHCSILKLINLFL